MTQVVVGQNENIESALRRFKTPSIQSRYFC